jgi:DnaJ-class molecular chaperone
MTSPDTNAENNTEMDSPEICSRCLGYGELARDIRECWMCNGTGMVHDE